MCLALLPVVGAAAVMAITTGCLVPPEIEVEPNYPPTVDTTLLYPAPDEVILDQTVNCATWDSIQIPDIAITDRNQNDEAFLRFFIAVNGTWKDEHPGFSITRLPFGYQVKFYPAAFSTALGDASSMLVVLDVLITDRPWPTGEEVTDTREVAPGANRAELFWVIQVTGTDCGES